MGEIAEVVGGKERLVLVEDTYELQCEAPCHQPFQTGGSSNLRELVQFALRMRPDRIIVGEVRGPEALDMIQAMNTGHAGSMSTVHANGPREALLRVETLAASADLRLDGDTLAGQLRSFRQEVCALSMAPGGPDRDPVSRARPVEIADSP